MRDGKYREMILSCPFTFANGASKLILGAER